MKKMLLEKFSDCVIPSTMTRTIVGGATCSWGDGIGGSINCDGYSAGSCTAVRNVDNTLVCLRCAGANTPSGACRSSRRGSQTAG